MQDPEAHQHVRHCSEGKECPRSAPTLATRDSLGPRGIRHMFNLVTPESNGWWIAIYSTLRIRAARIAHSVMRACRFTKSTANPLREQFKPSQSNQVQYRPSQGCR
jgi:hypothetical protein